MRTRDRDRSGLGRCRMDLCDPDGSRSRHGDDPAGGLITARPVALPGIVIAVGSSENRRAARPRPGNPVVARALLLPPCMGRRQALLALALLDACAAEAAPPPAPPLSA